jgi:hypothetical protein
MGSKYSGLALKPTDIRDDLVYLQLAYVTNSRHISEFPVMGLNTLLDRTMKTGITVVIGFINL